MTKTALLWTLFTLAIFMPGTATAETPMADAARDVEIPTQAVNETLPAWARGALVDGEVAETQWEWTPPATGETAADSVEVR